MKLEGIEMKTSLLALPLLIALALPAGSLPPAAMPLISSIESNVCKAGDVLSVQGENLGRDSVAALYLTDGKLDLKVLMIEQTANSIKFRVPPEVKPGRFALMVLTKESDPRLIEQPIRLVVEPPTTASAQF